MTISSKLKYLPIAAFAAVAVALAGCGGGGSSPVTSVPADTPTIAVAALGADGTIEAGTYQLTGTQEELIALAAAVDGIDEPPEGGYAPGVMVTIPGIGVLTCTGDVNCTVMVDGTTVTTTGTIMTAAETMMGGDPTDPIEPDTAADLAAAEAAVVAAQADVDALTDDSTVGEAAAANKALADTMTTRDDADEAHNAYVAMQPPTYDDLMAIDKAIGTPGMSPVTAASGEETSQVDGGKVTVNTGTPPANTYAKATWPVAPLSNWNGSVWEKSSGMVKDSVVVYTNVEDAKGVGYNTYYADGNTTPTTPPSGRSYKPWAGVASVAAGDVDDPNKPNVITLAATVGEAHSLFSAEMFPTGNGITQTYPDGDDVTTNIQVEFAGSFNGVAGKFACTDTTACTAATNAMGQLATLSQGWTFTADSKDAMVAGVSTDADYIDFGYWVKTDNSGDSVVYTVDAFFRGEALSGDVTNLEGSATYKGGAAGLYSKREFAAGGDGDLLSSGRFTADAELKAYFGGNTVAESDEDSISGTIQNFMDNGQMIDAGWLVKLNKIQGTDNFNVTQGTFTGGETTGDGTWSGGFYGVTDTNTTPHTLPSGVAGEFTAGFNNGSVIGAFGATKQP